MEDSRSLSAQEVPTHEESKFAEVDRIRAEDAETGTRIEEVCRKMDIS